MTITLGLRALGLLAFVAAATSAIVAPADQHRGSILSAIVAVSHP